MAQVLPASGSCLFTFPLPLTCTLSPFFSNRYTASRKPSPLTSGITSFISTISPGRFAPPRSLTNEVGSNLGSRKPIWANTVDISAAYPAEAGAPASAGYAADISTVFAHIGLRDPKLEPTSFVKLRGGANRPGEIVLMKEVMPDVRGLGLRDAVYLLEKNGLKVQVSGKGKVKRQEPEAGRTCAKGQQVFLELAG